MKSDALDRIGRLVEFSQLVRDVRDGKSKNASVGSDSAARASRRFIATLEQLYGCKFFETENQRIAVVDDLANELLDMMLPRIDGLRCDKDFLASLSRRRKAVRVGSIISIQAYLMPAVIETMQSQCMDVDLSMRNGSSRSQLEMLQKGEIDFMVYTTGLTGLKQFRITPIPLPYKGPEHGVVFLFHSKDGPGPFKEMNDWVNRKNASIGELKKLLVNLPRILMHIDIPDLQDSEMQFTNQWLSIVSGMNIWAGSFWNERLLLQRGLGIGFSGKPINESSFRLKPDGTRVILGTDCDFPEHTLAFVPFSQIPGMEVKRQQFCIYARDNYRSKNGGMSTAAREVVGIIEKICQHRLGKFGYLEFDDKDDHLVHNFTFTGHDRREIEEKSTKH